MRSCFFHALLLSVFACDPDEATAQVCRLPDSVRVTIPAQSPPEAQMQDAKPFAEIPLGIGHLRPTDTGAAPDLPPGSERWLQRLELPLSEAPDAPPFAWIARGWVINLGRPPVALPPDASVETEYEERSVIVLEQRNGWFRIRYSSSGTAWTPGCALEASPARFHFSPWSEWFLSDRISPMVFRAPVPEVLRSGPSAGSSALARISTDYALIPREVRGEWMRVELRQPSDFCNPDVTPTRSEGWVRWFAPDIGPRVWYFPRGC
jgi:hypothetical protein